MIRNLRLATGLVLFAYVVTHFVNHSLGLLSVDLADRVLRRIYHLWASAGGTLLLYGAFLIHYALALLALWRRRSLRMPAAELMQLTLGFAIPLLLTAHVLRTRVADTFYGSDSGYYSPLLYAYFGDSPITGALQFLTLFVAWIHAVIGLRFWLRLKPWYDRAQPFLYALALLLPSLAALGALVAGRQIAARAEDPAWVAALMARMPPPTAADLVQIDAEIFWLRVFFIAMILAVLAARLVRHQWYRAKGLVRITYPDGRIVECLPGLSVLEASRLAGIPHASACGGRGRCSTCRIWCTGELPPASALEAKVLERINAPPPVRLACQLRPLRDLQVIPLLPAGGHPSLGRSAALEGSEREIAILFCDLRGFTRLAEGMLPYDVVFLLNRYFAEMGQAIEAQGGHIDKFIGDGIMALFGIESGAAEGCRQALRAARAMSARLTRLNQSLAHDHQVPLRMGIGIHAGAVVVGRMGHGRNLAMTAIGDVVNTASRLEALTKTHECELILSETVAARAGVTLTATRQEVEIAGRRTKLAAYLIRTAEEMDQLPSPASLTRGTLSHEVGEGGRDPSA
ncbi:MAG TPA: adenylate/guanylate cyclase domain-containing protein [Stellaceae bacterium]|nr:adenylate/guanylate cyclase domain-containing protein [Stellaceae bacterium]